MQMWVGLNSLYRGPKVILHDVIREEITTDTDEIFYQKNKTLSNVLLKYRLLKVLQRGHMTRYVLEKKKIMKFEETGLLDLLQR